MPGWRAWGPIVTGPARSFFRAIMTIGLGGSGEDGYSE